MKNIIDKYFRLSLNLIKEKWFIIPLIITTILAYGFMFTNFSVGVDDLCLERYVSGTYILSAGRWGTWLVYKILNINTFTPFWLEFMCVLVIFITSIVLTSFIKQITKNKLTKLSYIMFALSFISYPIVCNFLVYQPTNLTVCISNLMLIFMVIILYEKYLQDTEFKINLVILFILAFGISMYESCCQTFVVLVFIVVLLYNKFNKELSFKDNIKFCFKCFLVLLVGIVLNFIICKILCLILDKFDLLTKDYASKSTILELIFKWDYSLKEVTNYKFHFLFKKYNFFALEFLIMGWLLLFVFIVEAIKDKNNKKYILWFLLAFLSNFILYFLMNACTFRICYSWMIFIGFSFIYFIEVFKKYKNIILIVCVWLILLQTRSTNQIFYNDYIGYQRDVNYSYSIINKIIDECGNIKKPLLIIESGNYKYYSDLKVVPDIRSDFYNWGIEAFDENGTEIVKFFNHLGYDFEVVDDYERYYYIYNELSNSEKNKDVIELNNFIVVKV